MFELTSHIKIGSYKINAVVDVVIESSWDTLTDTAKIDFPRRTEWDGKSLFSGANPIFKRNDPIEINIGYDGDNKRVFSGYLSAVKATVPVSVDCQDSAYLLKQSTITKSWKNATLKEVLDYILPTQIPYEAPAVTLGPIRVSNSTPAKVLEYLKEHYFLKSWLRNGTLYCGLAYVPALQAKHSISFELNVVEHSLEYIRKDDVKIMLKGISMYPDNTKEEYSTGDSTGEQRTVHFYDVSKSDLKTLTDAEIERLRYEGYRGSFTTFLKPQIQHGDIVKLTSTQYPERDGSYFVKSVTTTFGNDGGRQIVELDSKAS